MIVRIAGQVSPQMPRQCAGVDVVGIAGLRAHGDGDGLALVELADGFRADRPRRQRYWRHGDNSNSANETLRAWRSWSVGRMHATKSNPLQWPASNSQLSRARSDGLWAASSGWVFDLVFLPELRTAHDLEPDRGRITETVRTRQQVERMNYDVHLDQVVVAALLGFGALGDTASPRNPSSSHSSSVNPHRRTLSWRSGWRRLPDSMRRKV